MAAVSLKSLDPRSSGAKSRLRELLLSGHHQIRNDFNSHTQKGAVHSLWLRILKDEPPSNERLRLLSLLAEIGQKFSGTAEALVESLLSETDWTRFDRVVNLGKSLGGLESRFDFAVLEKLAEYGELTSVTLPLKKPLLEEPVESLGHRLLSVLKRRFRGPSPDEAPQVSGAEFHRRYLASRESLRALSLESQARIVGKGVHKSRAQRREDLMSEKKITVAQISLLFEEVDGLSRLTKLIKERPEDFAIHVSDFRPGNRLGAPNFSLTPE